LRILQMEEKPRSLLNRNEQPRLNN